jgi:hypothetical protein
LAREYGVKTPFSGRLTWTSADRADCDATELNGVKPATIGHAV